MSRRQSKGYTDDVLDEVVAVGKIHACGTTVPADASVGYAPGCLFTDYDGAAGAQLYINEGTAASSDFNVVTPVVQGQLAVSATSTVLNEDSADMDVRVESNANANFIVLDSSACLGGQLAIGAAIPTNPQALVAILPPANATGVTANQSYFHLTLVPGGATVAPTGTAPIVASVNLAEPNITATGTVTLAATLHITDAPTEGGTNAALYVAAGAAMFQGTTYIGDNSNAGVTLGLTINQGANDDEILALKSSDVAHGMTTVTETDTYGRFTKFAATDGGLFVDGLADTGATGMRLRGVCVTADGTYSTSGVGAVIIDGALKNTTTVASLGADKSILVVRDNGTARFMLDSDGDSHQDVATAWTNFDDHDDLVLLNSLSAHVARPGNELRPEFGGWLQANRERLEELRLVSFNDDVDGRPFVNMSRLTMLLTGAVRQLGFMFQGLQTRLAAAEAKLALGAP